MAKRKTFYVSAAIFSKPHSAYAVAVYAYLSFCADKQGVCFPSIETISKHTGMSRNTVKKSIEELRTAELIRAETTRKLSRNGRMRQSVNRYFLAVPLSRGDNTACQEMTTGLSCGDPTPGHVVTPPRSPDGREINNNSKDIIGDVPSVGITAREARRRDGSTGPTARKKDAGLIPRPSEGVLRRFLFVPQRVDRIEACRAVGGNRAEDHADHKREHHGRGDDEPADEDGHAGHFGDAVRKTDADQHA